MTVFLKWDPFCILFQKALMDIEIREMTVEHPAGALPRVRAAHQPHGPRTGAGARGHDAGREAGAADEVQAEGESADENPGRRPGGAVLRAEEGAGHQDHSAVGDGGQVHFLPARRLS